MVFNLKLSLEKMAMIKTAILLWNKEDIYLVSKLIVLGSLDRGLKWQEIETTLLEKVKQLCVPEKCKEKISGFVRPIGLEILRLMEYHVDLFTVGNDINVLFGRQIPEEKIVEALIIPDKIFWTTQGTVNGKKTAEMMTKQDNLDIRKRYILACSYCLEKEVVQLWNKMPEQYKQHFYSEEGPKNVQQPYIIVHWTYTLLGEASRLNEMLQGTDSAYYRLVEDAVDFVNFEATKFFMQELTDNEITENLLEFRTYMEQRRKRSAGMWLFLFAQLDEELEIPFACLRSILFSFLKWPWQSVFMEMVKCIGDGISVHFSYAILYEIADLVRHGYTDYNYQELFEEYWLYISQEHKRNVISRIMLDPKLLHTLLMVKDITNFYLILEEATAEECINIFCIKKPLIENYRYRTFMESIGKLFLTIDFVQFVYEFKLRILHRRSEEEIQRERQTWESFFESLDDCVHLNISHNEFLMQFDDSDYEYDSDVTLFNQKFIQRIEI